MVIGHSGGLLERQKGMTLCWVRFTFPSGRLILSPQWRSPYHNISDIPVEVWQYLCPLRSFKEGQVV